MNVFGKKNLKNLERIIRLCIEEKHQEYSGI